MGLLSDLSDYLENAAGQGRRHSSGAFTLDPARARELLAHFRLRGAEDCLLKWVQAAVAARASEIRVTLGRTHTTLLAEDCQVPLKGAEIHYFLGRPLDRSRSPARHLAVGLLSAWKAFPSHLVLEWHEGGVHRLNFRGATVTSEEDSDSLAEGQFRVEWQRSLSGSFWERFRRFLRGQLSEHTALRACRLAVTPVLVDARPLERERNPVACRDAGQLKDVPPNFPLLVAYHSASGAEPGAFVTDLPLAIYRGHRLERTTSKTVEAGIVTRADTAALRKLYPAAAERGTAVWLRIEVRASLSGPGRVVFVHDGVVIEERRLALGVPGAVAWVSAHGLTTDLSEFRLVEDEAFQNRCAAIQQSLLDTLSHCTEALRELLRGHPKLLRRLQAYVPGLRALPKPARPKKVRAPERAHDELAALPPRTLKPNDRRPR